MKHYEYRLINGMRCVLIPGEDRGKYPDANFMGTRKALAGILKDDETFEDWLKRKEKRLKKI